MRLPKALARQALVAQQRVLGPDHPETLVSVDFVQWLAELGQHEAAADMARQAFGCVDGRP